MRKIDLHVHTIATPSDGYFEFSLSRLRRYVEEATLDAIAVTNHNVFDPEQYEEIANQISILVLPGLEVNLADGHALLITDPVRAADLAESSELLKEFIRQPTDRITIDQLGNIFGDLSDFLIIPHHEKRPAIQPQTIQALAPHITAGEVDSAKKFMRCLKDESRLVPVLFSDLRASSDLGQNPTRATFISCGDVTFSAIKATLADRQKVFLSPEDGNALFPVLEDGLFISTGLNVVLGDRSSGKTHTLNQIKKEQENVKHIEQFSLVQLDDKHYEREFTSELDRRRSIHTEKFLGDFKNVVEAVKNIDLNEGEDRVERYLATLIRSAEETHLADSFSNAALFSETTFKTGDDVSLKSLIEAVRHLAENIDYREVIERHVTVGSLMALAVELIESLWTRTLERKKRELVNEIVTDVRLQLGVRSSAVQLEDVDLYEVLMDKKRVERFEGIVNAVRTEEPIYENEIQGFKIVAKKGPYSGAGDLRGASGKNIKFSDAFEYYDDPYEYLRVLKAKGEIPDSDLYRFFVKIEYEILNKDGFRVSGGERSEFRLLQEISDAQHFDMLLLDEPESSFDNTFLRSKVNALLKDIAKIMPVVVVTHNSTVGASIGADYVLYAEKKSSKTGVEYRIYSGFPTDKVLTCVDGSEIGSHVKMLHSLEAGPDAYEERRRGYEAIENQ